MNPPIGVSLNVDQWHNTPHSSNVTRFGHTDESDLIVEFQGGAYYIYDNVSRFVVRDLIDAKSPGSFIARNIKPIHECRRLTPDEVQTVTASREPQTANTPEEVS